MGFNEALQKYEKLTRMSKDKPQREIRPTIDKHTRLNVAVNVLSLSNIDTIAQTFDCDFVLRCETVNVSEVNRQLSLEKQEQLSLKNWNPRLRFLNLIETKA